jgi:proline iminopeptidase
MNHEIARRAFGPGGFMRCFDLRGELSRITAPTLILAGRHDFVCAPEFSEELHTLIGGSQLQIFEDSAHLIGLDEPERYLAAISAFVSAQGSCQNG